MRFAWSLVAPGATLATMSNVTDSVQFGASMRCGDRLYAARMRFFNETCVNVIRSGEPVPGPPHPVTGQKGHDPGRKDPTGAAAGLMDAASKDGRRS